MGKLKNLFLKTYRRNFGLKFINFKIEIFGVSHLLCCIKKFSIERVRGVVGNKRKVKLAQENGKENSFANAFVF